MLQMDRRTNMEQLVLTLCLYSSLMDHKRYWKFPNCLQLQH